MTKHMLAQDLVKLGWDRALAEAAEETLKGLAEMQSEFDAGAEAAATNELPSFDLVLNETSSIPHWVQDGTSGRPTFRAR